MERVKQLRESVDRSLQSHAPDKQTGETICVAFRMLCGQKINASFSGTSTAVVSDF